MTPRRNFQPPESDRGMLSTRSDDEHGKIPGFFARRRKQTRENDRSEIAVTLVRSSDDATPSPILSREVTGEASGGIATYELPKRCRTVSCRGGSEPAQGAASPDLPSARRQSP